MDIVFSLVGFAGFEGMRILKRLGADKRPLPEQVGVYIIALLIVAIFAGAVGYAMDLNSGIKSLFVGFSIPSSGKAIFEPYTKANNQNSPPSNTVDDMDVKILTRFGIKNLCRVYFGE